MSASSPWFSVNHREQEYSNKNRKTCSLTVSYIVPLSAGLFTKIYPGTLHADLPRTYRVKRKLTIRTVKSLKPAAKPYEVRDTDIKGFLLRVQPSGVMTYFIAYQTPNSKRNRYRIGRHGTINPVQARDAAERLAAKVAHGVDLQADKKAARAEAERATVRSLRSFLDKSYEAWAESHRKTGRDTCRRVRLHFADLMVRPMEEITPWVIEKWRTTRLKAQIAPVTVNRDIAALRSVLSKAVEWDVLNVHPLAKLKPSKVSNNPKVRYLSEDEETRLRRALLERETRIRTERANANQWRRERDYPELPDLTTTIFVDHLRPMILLAMNTGLRRGELFSLTWQDVNFQRAYLTVGGSKAKSGATRHVPLNAEALDVLTKSWRSQTDGKGVVFPGRHGKPLNNVQKSWSAVLSIVSIKNFRFHDLRHHFASKLVMAGVDLNTVRELLGHSDIKMTLRYAHLAPEHKAAAVERLVSSRS